MVYALIFVSMFLINYIDQWQVVFILLFKHLVQKIELIINRVQALFNISIFQKKNEFDTYVVYLLIYIRISWKKLKWSLTGCENFYKHVVKNIVLLTNRLYVMFSISISWKNWIDHQHGVCTDLNKHLVKKLNWSLICCMHSFI